MLSQLWQDESGAVVSTEHILVLTILVMGMIVGGDSFEDAIVEELADIAQACADEDQSYSYSGVSGHSSSTSGSEFRDQRDFCDTPTGPDNFQTSKCVSVNAAAASPG